MAKKDRPQKLHAHVSIDQETGEVAAVYFHVREGKAAEVQELEEGACFANYDSQGRLLGVELLAPCEVTVFDKIVRSVPAADRKKYRKFMKGSVPRELVLS